MFGFYIHYSFNFNSRSFSRFVNSITRIFASLSLKPSSRSFKTKFRSFKAKSLSLYSSSSRFKADDFFVVFSLSSSLQLSSSESEIISIVVFFSFFLLEIIRARFDGVVFVVFEFLTHVFAKYKKL